MNSNRRPERSARIKIGCSPSATLKIHQVVVWIASPKSPRLQIAWKWPVREGLGHCEANGSCREENPRQVDKHNSIIQYLSQPLSWGMHLQHGQLHSRLHILAHANLNSGMKVWFGLIQCFVTCIDSTRIEHYSFNLCMCVYIYSNII